MWTGPLQSAGAFREWLHDPPSLVWPNDRSWFVGIPINSREIAVAGSTPTIATVLANPELKARRANADDELDGDDEARIV